MNLYTYVIKFCKTFKYFKMKGYSIYFDQRVHKSTSIQSHTVAIIKYL